MGSGAWIRPTPTIGTVDRSLTEVAENGRDQHCTGQRQGKCEGYKNSFHRRI
jgi:hypothetical protein